MRYINENNCEVSQVAILLENSNSETILTAQKLIFELYDRELPVETCHYYDSLSKINIKLEVQNDTAVMFEIIESTITVNISLTQFVDGHNRYVIVSDRDLYRSLDNIENMLK